MSFKRGNTKYSSPF